MQKNSIALAFSSFGIGSHPEEWYLSDYLKAHYPDTVQRIINSNCTETADRLLVDLMNQIAAGSSKEAQSLIDWLQGLRQLHNGDDLRSVSERPSMNRSFVTE